MMIFVSIFFVLPMWGFALVTYAIVRSKAKHVLRTIEMGDLVAVKVENYVMLKYTYFPSHVTALRRHQYPEWVEHAAVPVRNLLMVFNRATEDVIEGDVLFAVVEDHIPARLVIRLKGTMIYVNLNPSIQLQD